MPQIEQTPITKLCQTYNVVTVNGQLPGPTLHVRNGDTLIVKVHNRAHYNASIHWYDVSALQSYYCFCRPLCFMLPSALDKSQISNRDQAWSETIAYRLV